MSGQQKQEVQGVGKTQAISLLNTINETAPGKIALLDEVKSRFVQNYNLTNINKMGEIEYQRQMIYFNQAISASNDLQNADRFSLYGALMTLAINGYDLDPQSKQLYLLAMGGKAVIWLQAPAHIARLVNRGVIKSAGQPKLVYRSELPNFKVNMGKVVSHEENFDIQENDQIIAAYIIFTLPDDTEKHIIYRAADWAAWRSKSKQPNGANWNGKNGQPDPGFLRTKVVKHAALDSSWPSMKRPQTEQYDSIIDLDEEDVEVENLAKTQIASKPDNINTITPPPPAPPIQQPETIQEIGKEDLDFSADQSTTTNEHVIIKIEEEEF